MSQAQWVISPAKFAADTRWAAAKRPVRDKNTAMAISVSIQTKATVP